MNTSRSNIQGLIQHLSLAMIGSLKLVSMQWGFIAVISLSLILVIYYITQLLGLIDCLAVIANATYPVITLFDYA